MGQNVQSHSGSSFLFLLFCFSGCCFNNDKSVYGKSTYMASLQSRLSCDPTVIPDTLSPQRSEGPIPWSYLNQFLSPLKSSQFKMMDLPVHGIINVFSIPLRLQVVLHAGGVEIQSASQPAQVCWDFHSGCLGLTGLSSSTWRSRHNPGLAD